MTNFSNTNSGTGNDPLNKPGQSRIPSVPIVSGTQAKPVLPSAQQASVGKLGRGLGRLIPIKNPPGNAEKTTFTSVDSSSTAMQSVTKNTSVPSNQTTISNSSSTGIKLESKNVVTLSQILYNHDCNEHSLLCVRLQRIRLGKNKNHEFTNNN
jgi:hypothetical protein